MPEVILAWQRKLLKEGGAKKKSGKDGKPDPGKPLSAEHGQPDPRPLSATFKLAVQAGMIPINQLLQAPRLKPRRRSRSTGHLRRLASSWPSWKATARGRYRPSSSVPVAHRRTRLVALAQRGSEEPPGADRRLRLDPRLRHDALESARAEMPSGPSISTTGLPTSCASRRSCRRPSAWQQPSGSSPISSSPGRMAVSTTR